MRIQKLLTQNRGNVSGFFGGNLCLVVLHGGGVRSFTLVSGSLSSPLPAGGNGSHIGVSLGLGSLRSGHHSGHIGI